MRAKPVVYEGIHFRSKLEARWYIFMKKLGWRIEYEPEIEGLNGWLPDFLIIGEKHKTLVDVKPIQTVNDWYKPCFESSRNKILNSGIKNLHDYELLILGTNLQLDSMDSMGIFYVRFDKWVYKDNPNITYKKSDRDESAKYVYNYDEINNRPIYKDQNGKELLSVPGEYLEEDGNVIFSRAGYSCKSHIGFMTYHGNWVCRISGESGKSYLHRDAYDEDYFKKIDTYWNEAWAELRWKGKEVA